MGVKADDEPIVVRRSPGLFPALLVDCRKSFRPLTGSPEGPKDYLDSDLRIRPPEMIWVIGAFAYPLLACAALLPSEQTFLA